MQSVRVKTNIKLDEMKIDKMEMAAAEESFAFYFFILYAHLGF
jgi:hypothetical protein